MNRSFFPTYRKFCTLANINPILCLEHVTRFVRQRYNRMVIRDIIRVDVDDLIVMMSSTEANLAYWADGVLFACFSMAESESLSTLELEGTTYIERVIFAKYPTFTRTIKSTTNFEILAVNVQSSELYNDLIQWLKSQPIWND